MITTSTPSDVLYEYKNGDYLVRLYRDGSKERIFEETKEGLAPAFPESVDVKITDYCDAGCPWCHESSTVRGRHGETELFWSFAKSLPAGVELAIGGGNPLSHPDLLWILKSAKEFGKVANITVNSRHIAEGRSKLEKLAGEGLVRGIGVSYDAVTWPSAREFVLAYPDAVVHLIAGVDVPADIFRMAKQGVRRFLVLGYKLHGRGMRGVNGAHAKKLKAWEYWMPRLIQMGKHFTMAFDNLALETLHVGGYITAESWERTYMGKEGEFSMFYDLVEDQYAISSTSPRKPRNGRTGREMFVDICPGKVFFEEEIA